MDCADTKFGRGPREFGGSVDLIKQCKLWPHHEFFCKRPLPVEISETRYFQNVVGEVKIEKGEGMELDQLLQNASAVENRHPDLHPFDMSILTEAFKMRETSHADLSYAEKGNGRKMFELKGDSIDNKKRGKHKIRDKDKSMDFTRRHHQKNIGTKKDDGKTSKGHHDIDPNNLQKLQDIIANTTQVSQLLQKRKFEGGDDFSGIQKCQRTKLKNLKVKNVGMSRITN